MDEQLKLMDQVTSAAIEMGIQFGPRLLVATLILIAGFFAARWAGRALVRAVAKFKLEPPVVALVERAAQLLVLGLFVIMALQNLGVELLPLIAGLGIAGAGVALAMQGVLGNMVAGLTIIFSRPFRVGDYISIVKEEGEVLEIKLFSTTLGHSDLSRVVIPNRKIVGEILHNFGMIKQLKIGMGVASPADVPRALAAVNDVLGRQPRVLKDPAPVFAVSSVVDNGIRINVGPWVAGADTGLVEGELYHALIEEFRARQIDLGLHRELRLVNGSVTPTGTR